MSKYTITYFSILVVLEVLMLTTHYKIAGMVLGLSIFIGIFYAYFYKVHRVFMIAWMLGFAPLVVFIRPFIFSESGFTLLTIITVLLAFVGMRKDIERALKNKYILFILVFFVLYVAIGLIIGSRPIVFLKVIELGTTLVLISILLYFPEYRSFAFRNFIYSSIAVYIVMFPYIANRFAVPTEIGSTVGGDPSGMAALLVISLIFVFFDNGKMILFNQKSKVLFALTVIVFTFLFLSTSRTNMAAMFGIMAFYALNNKSNFIKYFIVLVAMIIVSLSVLDDKYMNTIEKYYVKKLDTKNRSMDQLTTHRFIQWQISLHYLSTAPLLDVLIGYGPGNRTFTYMAGREYVKDFGFVPGAISHYVFHTLYLLLAIEYGLIAFALFMFVLFRAIYVNFGLYLKKKEMLLYFSIAYVLTISGNAGLGIIGGMYLAFIFAGPKIFNEKYLQYDGKNIV